MNYSTLRASQRAIDRYERRLGCFRSRVAERIRLMPTHFPLSDKTVFLPKPSTVSR